MQGERQVFMEQGAGGLQGAGQDGSGLHILEIYLQDPNQPSTENASQVVTETAAELVNVTPHSLVVPQPKKRKPNAKGPSKKSSCWDHFIELADVPERTAACKHCHKVVEKLRLKAFFRSDCSRVVLTTDCWTSLQNLSYMTITAHFIDNDWNYQKRIISFSSVPNHKGDTVDLDEEYEVSEDVIAEFQQMSLAGTVGSGAAAACGAAAGSSQSQPLGCD